LVGLALRRFRRDEAAVFLLMKKSSRRDHPSETSRRSQQACSQNGGSEGRWEFTASGSLIALGATESVRRAAYRTATGELRFFPL